MGIYQHLSQGELMCLGFHLLSSKTGAITILSHIKCLADGKLVINEYSLLQIPVASLGALVVFEKDHGQGWTSWHPSRRSQGTSRFGALTETGRHLDTIGKTQASAVTQPSKNSVQHSSCSDVNGESVPCCQLWRLVSHNSCRSEPWMR